MYQFIDYVAISITCDMVAKEDNRVLASLGLEAMKQGNFSAPNIPRLIGDRYIDEGVSHSTLGLRLTPLDG